MRGTILSYDEADEEGLIQGEDGKEYIFSLTYCYGFDEFPTEGDRVEYGLENTELYFVELCSQKTSKTPNNTTPSVLLDASQKEIVDVDLYAPITPKTTISGSLNDYFSEIIIDLEEFEFDFREHESLDFIKMRRFLFTAYRNLLDLDPKFVNNDLVAFHEYVTELYKVYQSFVKRLSIPQSAYEEIYLRAQPQYVWRKERLESNKGEMITLQGVIKNITYKIEGLKNRMARSKEDAASLESEYKRSNGMYVDNLHRIATLREENSILSEELQSFEEAHYATFVTEFTRFARERKEQISRLLDGYAYYFDKKMWECAEQSLSIREFFRKADVHEEFSSKTYLKYYLRGIDELKMSVMHRELKTLLAYLESLSQISVVLIDEDKESRSRLLKILRLAGTDVRVSALERVKVFHQRLQKEPIDLVLIDVNISNPTIIKSIETIYEIEKKRERKCRICLLGTSFSSEHLHEFTKRGISHFILKNAPEKQLSIYIDKLLQGLGKDQLEIND